jgi:hypothetical protein
VPLARSAKLDRAGPDRRSLSIGEAGWTLRYDNREGDWMAYEYRAQDRQMLVSGSLPWQVCAEPLAGVVCGVLLGLRQRTLLHGACVKLGGASFALLGASGHGKSTLTAALLKEGATLVTEDLLVAARRPSGWTVEPGAPTLHLLEDAYAMVGAGLGGRGQAAPRVREGKYALDLMAAVDGARPGPPILAGIYLLDPPASRESTELVRLSGRRALLRVLEHLYGAGWIRAVAECDLHFCADLVADVPVHVLSQRWRLEEVPETAALLRRHVLAA